MKQKLYDNATKQNPLSTLGLPIDTTFDSIRNNGIPFERPKNMEQEKTLSTKKIIVDKPNIEAKILKQYPVTKYCHDKAKNNQKHRIGTTQIETLMHCHNFD